MLDLKEFLIDSPYKREIKQLISISNLAFKNWETYWTDFIPSYAYSEILKSFSNLNDLSYQIYGGYENADRAKIACYRKSINKCYGDIKGDFPGVGIDIRGNFLFDNASQSDFRNLLVDSLFKKEHIGDIWTLGDRGAQGIINQTELKSFSQNKFFLRDIEVEIRIVNLDELRLPTSRTKKYISTVEASKRLDAIASAGFRVSRSKIIDRIKKGLISVNGLKVYKPTFSTNEGDIINLENKGLVKILSMERTKRERWKIKLIKK
tara:strand:- start:579 stop:1370 length:792 start_codon:yes stop_codon:yes gene_type:complete